MSNVDLINLFAAVMSLVLAVVAIYLAVLFYKMSERQAEKADAASAAIASSVDRLERLFGLMYTDTFGMMKDTVADIRGQLWRRMDKPSHESIDKMADGRIAELKRELMVEVASVSARVGIAGDELANLRRALEPVLAKAVDEGSSIEAYIFNEFSLEEHILWTLDSWRRELPAEASVAAMTQQLDRYVDSFGRKITPERIRAELLGLYNKGVITWRGGPTALDRPGTQIQLRLQK